MSLLSANDPRYWLGKIIAEPSSGLYDRAALLRAISGVAQANLAALAALQDGVDRYGWPWEDAFVQNLQNVVIPRMDAFNQKYTRLIQTTRNVGQVSAPDFKSDAIEMLTHAAAAIDGIRNKFGNVSALELLQGAAARAGASLFEAIAGTIKKIVMGLAIGGSVLITAGLAAVGLWAYVNLKRPSYRR